jgi:hypothetical protein
MEEASGPLQDSGYGTAKALTDVASPTYRLTGKVGYAVSVNGAQYFVDQDNIANHHYPTGGSLEAWFKTTDTAADYNCIAGKADSYALFVHTSILIAYDWEAGAQRTTNINVADDLWHHAVLTWTGAGNTGIVYLDGVNRFSGVYGSPDTAALSYFAIGANGTGIQAIAATIDEVALYTTPLTQAQVSNHYNAGR